MAIVQCHMTFTCKAHGVNLTYVGTTEFRKKPQKMCPNPFPPWRFGDETTCIMYNNLEREGGADKKYDKKGG